MKLKEQLRTFWHEFWMWYYLGPAAKELEQRINNLKEKPYWIPMVANNSYAIAKALDRPVDPKTEDEAHTLYSGWCAKTDVAEEDYAQAIIAASKLNKKPLEATFAEPKLNAELSNCMTELIIGEHVRTHHRLFIPHSSGRTPCVGLQCQPHGALRRSPSTWHSAHPCQHYKQAIRSVHQFAAHSGCAKVRP